MALDENLDVSLTSLDFNRLWGRNIEIPATGDQSEIYTIDLRMRCILYSLPCLKCKDM
jgi:hypothetical protein